MNINFLYYRAIRFDGYGRFVLALWDEMERQGWNIHASSTLNLEVPQEKWSRLGIDIARTTLTIAPLHELRTGAWQQFAYSMYESERIPDGWAAHANAKASAVLTPCEWNAEVFKANGVKRPVHVVHAGTDVSECEVFPNAPDGKRPYTFIALGDRGSRKGWDFAWAAFCQAFKPTDDVRFIVKARSWDALTPGLQDARRGSMGDKLSFWCEEVDRVRDVFAQADCCVYPTRGDGWGMWCREAAACGLPTIATNYSGTAVGCEHWAIPILNYVLVNSELPHPRTPGQWAQPSIDEIAGHMRWCYDNPEAAKAKGLAAAAWIRENQTWAHTVKRLAEVIDGAVTPKTILFPVGKSSPGAVERMGKLLEVKQG